MERVIVVDEQSVANKMLVSPKPNTNANVRAEDMNGATSSGSKNEDVIIQSIFRGIDDDGDGRVSASEIVRFVEKVGLSMSSTNEVESIVRATSNSEDADPLSLHALTEFYHALFEQSHHQSDDDGEEALSEAFRVFDENGDGVISAAELGNVLCKLGYEEHGRDEMHCRMMIRRAVLNGDGLIDIHEVRHLLSQTSSACAH